MTTKNWNPQNRWITSGAGKTCVLCAQDEFQRLTNKGAGLGEPGTVAALICFFYFFPPDRNRTFGVLPCISIYLQKKGGAFVEC